MTNPTLLVVEDEILLRLDMADLAQRVGFSTREAASADEALAILETEQPVPVLVTDINMPGELNGLALAHTVRQRWPSTVIVVCSGDERPGPEDLPRHTSFFAKPCIGAEVERLLSRAYRILTGVARDRVLGKF